MPVDNELYNRLHNTWWDENTALGILRSWIGPVRFGYFQSILTADESQTIREKTVLDVGCGGGLLAEEFARLPCHVTGIDPAEESLETARRHAQLSGLIINYEVGVGEHIPFDDASFDVVVCCDVLEHVNSVEPVIQEIARVLKPGGYFFYDTINRSALSWLVMIKMAQDWKATSFMPPNLHDWHKFIKPKELQLVIRKYQLENQDVKGMSPQTNPLHTISMFLRQKRGTLTLSDMGQRMRFKASRDLSTSYMGYAIKTSHS
ncbi:bifunctional 2-polyprenyl-6-hydroxyphenol methylase/3-demethylubiquinol 3-O-methyltransferase UbiG [Dictyobacter arantiisoli]|uniref:Ubiquinone biosynthesis O-methyltransferase n=1 Tax=Dictyobacter arantiisoli TaxID=2014874 RepID=A0A5A5TJ61_9CHLR|nr:bifunctional 2-polyprenyl-6-hydroxyphenol methylase/3-demethylubiquinol 3-O-methyltransferase UbiG [Dictyobacter arantiisoli]GCF11166.1 ubiquinone biosynthesis O-methyltransferase [Dictyobacter arantiisoli]